MAQAAPLPGGDTLSECVSAAINRDEPSWKVIRRLSGSLSAGPSAFGIWEGDGYKVNITLSVYPSAREAAEDLNRQRTMSRTAMAPSPLRSTRNDFQKANVIVVVDVFSQADMPMPGLSSIARKTGRLVDGLIGADIKVDACTNELYPMERPTPDTPDEAFLRDVESGCLLRVEQALAAGADVNARDERGISVLARAVAGGRRELVQLLLRAGASLGAPADPGGSALFRVSSRPSAYYTEDLPKILANQIAIADDLLAAGADINGRDAQGQTLLLEIARLNYDDGSPALLLKALIERGADLSVQDREGKTALILSILHTHAKVSLETVKALLAARADVNAQDAAGKTAIEYAQEKAEKYPEQEWGKVLRLLADAGAIYDPAHDQAAVPGMSIDKQP